MSDRLALNDRLVLSDRLTLIGPDLNGLWCLASQGRVEVSTPDTPPPMISGEYDHVTCSDGRILPGYVNGHTHIYSGLVPLGLEPPEPPPKNFTEILEKVWWRLDRALDAETLRAAARLYVAEALLLGTTGLIDHHESPDLIDGSLDILATACEELGIRAALCYGITERNGGTEEASRGLDECAEFIRNRETGLLKGMIGLHASFTVSDETITRAGDLCRELGRPLHLHLAEDGSDVDDAKERGYEGPLERLESLDCLPKGSILAHCIHLDEAQVRRADERGCWIVQNPRSNHGNGVGYPTSLAASGRVALGTDGYPSDMDAEDDTLRRMAAANNDPGGAVARRALGSQELMSELFDTQLDLEGASEAPDLIIVDCQGVRDVYVNGTPVVRDRLLVNGDIDEIRSEAGQQAKRLWSRMDSGY